MNNASAQRVGQACLRTAFNPQWHSEHMEASDWMDLGMWMLGLDPRSVMDTSREGILAVI